MHLSYHKFTVAGMDEHHDDEHNDWDAPVSIQCTVCGLWEIIADATLDDLTEWGSQHDCPKALMGVLS